MRCEVMTRYVSGLQVRIMKAGLFVASLFISLVPASLQAVEITLDRPGDREFLRDQAQLLSAADSEEIRTRCDKLLTDKATPIIVITIDRMADHGGEGMRIETFARLLFDKWEIGQAQLNGQTWNTGILLLVSSQDRKARIELGNGWGRDKDAVCDRIMQDQIIPRFKQRDFSGGIRAGVLGLDAMVRELPMPGVAVSASASTDSSSSEQGFTSQATPGKKTDPWILLGMAALAVFTVVSLVRSGSNGWAWFGWAIVFTLVGSILYSLTIGSVSRRSSWGGGSGGGFGGGSFGGGFSGGGGSTGSW